MNRRLLATLAAGLFVTTTPALAGMVTVEGEVRQGTPAILELLVQDETDGLSGIEVVRSVNTQTQIVPFDAGTQDGITVYSALVDGSGVGLVGLKLTNPDGTTREVTMTFDSKGVILDKPQATPVEMTRLESGPVNAG